ncbi:GIY-YIG nuclease family protein [Bradyrhizobium sp. SSUT112]|uniref:GIY-YIG nuclease family protein n=1 Tax=Bradyrhizobium sp. SSUT112 TaxID=3040604 RepID=UPI00244B7C4E|nr:GIY-YIG nuclease family protein [Bradyrhizobium sp. SSUT112]MDH2353333.1 GIY-YIG nuclease family protein [Bradyrhizobium sp. SSUT112]
MEELLTASELSFLRSQGLGPDDVMDVRRLPQWLWFQRIKEEGKTIALGSRCRKAGHRLRSTRGHCVQCDTKILAFAGRYALKQYLYIAGSLRARLIKIGVCRDLQQRLRQICAERHGDARDWEVIYAVHIERAAEIEERVLNRLAEYSFYSTYWKDGNIQQSIELRRCTISQAIEAMTAALEGKEYALAINWRDKSAYEFK